MRRTTGAILIETRPERMRRSAWRGDARKASKPKRATSTREATMDIISIAQQARPNVAGNMAFPRAQDTALSSVVVMTRCSTYSSRSLPSRSPRSMSRARSCWTRKSAFSASPCFSRLTISMPTVLAPFERAPPPDVHEGDDEEGDEDDGLDQRERPEVAQLHRDRIEEDDLDVEQDEQHRDQVEADPETEPLLDLGGHPALVGVTLIGRGRLGLRSQEAAGGDERRTDEAAETEEDDGWKVRAEHSTSRCITNL